MFFYVFLCFSGWATHWLLLGRMWPAGHHLNRSTLTPWLLLFIWRMNNRSQQLKFCDIVLRKVGSKCKTCLFSYLQNHNLCELNRTFREKITNRCNSVRLYFYLTVIQCYNILTNLSQNPHTSHKVAGCMLCTSQMKYFVRSLWGE